MAVRDHFSDEELAAVRTATQAAEAKTGAELVCVIVEQCDSYEETLWKAATFGAWAGALAAALWHTLTLPWGGSLVAWIGLPPVLGAAVGLGLALILPALRRFLVAPEVLDQRADRRAAATFLSEEISATRDRSGVLLFVALFERRIRILRDSEIERRVPADAWDPILRDLRRGLRTGHAASALVQAISACGELLATHDVMRRLDDIDELSNEPRLYDD